MREEVIGAGWLNSPEAPRTTVRESGYTELGSLRTPGGWNPENFARQQIRGLVRQIFFSNAVRPVRQVVISALELETEVRNLCRNVGETLARETAGSVAVVGAYPRLIRTPEAEGEEPADDSEATPLRQIASRPRGNLWLVPDGLRETDSSKSLNSYLGDVRREFDYSIVQGRVAGESDEATAMAQFADGIILVLSARRTRRATARNVKRALEAAHANILGTVLSEREFPIPQAIYRRL
jgi:hypothetical protein